MTAYVTSALVLHWLDLFKYIQMSISLLSVLSRPVRFRVDVSAHLRASPSSFRSYPQLLPSSRLLRLASMVNPHLFLVLRSLRA
jgi:hypothetical protein